MSQLNDRELGYQAGFCGLESKYPFNTNYARGYQAGLAALLRGAPLPGAFHPLGANDAHADQHHIGVEVKP